MKKPKWVTPDMAPGAEPEWDRNVPTCPEDACSQFDGKPCKLQGFRPGTLCEPMVSAMGSKLKRLSLPVEPFPPETK